MVNGAQSGLWVTRHRNGQPRVGGEMEDGTATGFWMFWREDGEPYAAGRVENGRLTGEWTTWKDGEPSTWEPDAIRPPGPMGGEWSSGSIADAESVASVVERWLSEARSPLDAGATTLNEKVAVAAAPAGAQEAEVAVQPRVPLKGQPDFTEREKAEMDAYEEAYGMNPPPIRRVGVRYGPRTAGKPRGNTALSQALIGKRLPRSRFETASGKELDLEKFRGRKKVLMVILRGFAGQVCVYCATQTQAYSKSNAFDEFRRLNTQVLVMYPGPEEGLDAFRDIYERTFGGELPPYEILYDPDLEFVTEIGIAGNLATPTTLLLDEDGIVRYAYVGKHIADRPAVKDVLEAVGDLE